MLEARGYGPHVEVETAQSSRDWLRLVLLVVCVLVTVLVVVSDRPGGLPFGDSTSCADVAQADDPAAQLDEAVAETLCPGVEPMEADADEVSSQG